MVTPEQLKEWISVGLADEATVSVDGDGHHFEALIVTPDFEGKNRIQRHQFVYAILGAVFCSFEWIFLLINPATGSLSCLVCFLLVRRF